MSPSVSDLTPGVSDGSADAVLAGLDPEQRAVATALHGPVCVLAGAGTGKTRAVTHRIAYGVRTGTYDPARVLAVTFTQRAAGEMRGRLAQLGAHGVQARTFHSAALRQARWFWPKVYAAELPPIADRKFPFLAEAASRCRVQADTTALRDLAGEVEWAKVSNVRPDDYARVAPQFARAPAGFDPATVARVFAAYEDVKTERGRIDLEDVLLCAVALLAEDERVAAEVRRQYRTFVVDEYQDVSPLQQSLLELWLGGREEVCVVGDPAQTIYSWAGADPANLVGFAKRHPGATVVELVRDYRSTPQVVEVANKVLDATGPAGLPGRVTLRSQRTAGPVPTYTEYADEVAEADAIARTIEDLSRAGTPLREIAVLFRTNAQSESFEQALAERGIPAMLKGVERFFERAEIRQAGVLLRGQVKAAVVPAGSAASTGAGDAAGGGAGGGASEAGDGEGLGQVVRGVLAGAGWSAEAPAGTGAVRDRWESLTALVSMADEYAAARPRAGLPDFMTELDRRAAIQHAPVADGVTLATLHAAKGLEWRCVFIAGAHEGTLPIAYAQTPRQVEEERRLFYVGITRAKDRLMVTWAAARSPGGRAQRGPTRFLTPLGVGRSAPAAAMAGAAGTGRRRGGKTVPRCRICGRGLLHPAARKLGRCEDCPSTLDEDLYARLLAWRSERAAEQKVPAYVVFTDATLTAIAEIRPADELELLRITGIGKVKVDRYGEDVVRICRG